MNEVDHLNNPFLHRPVCLAGKRLGPHRPHDIQITQTDKQQNRKFSPVTLAESERCFSTLKRIMSIIIIIMTK